VDLDLHHGGEYGKVLLGLDVLHKFMWVRLIARMFEAIVLCSSVMQIVGCLDDAAIGSDGNAVYEIAYQVIWVCLVEESALFLRYVFERLTRDRQDQMFKLLRHLIRFVPRLPQQAAFALYNSIIGYIMFYVRSSNELKQEVVGFFH